VGNKILNNLMPKIIKNILILSAAFILVVVLVGYFWNQQKKNFEEAASSQDLSQIKPILPEDILKTGESNYKEFTSPDGKLKIKYPSDWLEIKDEKSLEGIIPEEWKERYNLQTLFFAQELKTGEIGQIIVNKGDFDIQIEEIIEEMKKSNQTKGWTMEIINSNLEEGIFEAKYQKTDHYDLHSKEKILFSDGQENTKKAYLTAFIVFDKDWEKFENKANEVINSVQLVD